MPTSEMPSSRDAVEIVKEAKNGVLPGAEIAGPMALDVAISEKAATIKGINNLVAGKADILLMPNLEAGNIELQVPLIKSKNKNKNDLIFYLLLITHIFVFKFYKKKNE